jgi:hypothetical protein
LVLAVGGFLIAVPYARENRASELADHGAGRACRENSLQLSRMGQAPGDPQADAVGLSGATFAALADDTVLPGDPRY